jgi:hypothetical protein
MTEHPDNKNNTAVRKNGEVIINQFVTPVIIIGVFVITSHYPTLAEYVTKLTL